MATNPFEDEDKAYLTLVNDQGQHSLWPAEIDVPPGWRTVFNGNREACLDYIESHWTDMRPASIRDN